MDIIFHEKQEGSLCAQHCLNALLQGAYFTAVDLANLASQLDDEERQRFSEGGEISESLTGNRSHNMDESGFFSVQVISRALGVWGLELVPLLRQSEEAAQARANPASENAYICNFGEHWFTIRRLGTQWFDLNSTSSGPRLISPTYLALYLAQLQQDRHSIFVVTGKLPDCEADQMLSLCPISAEVSSTYANSRKGGGKKITTQDREAREAIELVSTLEASQEEKTTKRGVSRLDEDSSFLCAVQASRSEQEDADLQRALRLSAETRDERNHCDERDNLEAPESSPSLPKWLRGPGRAVGYRSDATVSTAIDAAVASEATINCGNKEEDEQTVLMRAIAMSLQQDLSQVDVSQSTATNNDLTTVAPATEVHCVDSNLGPSGLRRREEIRAKRQAFLDSIK